MVWHLISATPSPYARKIRIALQEKKLPFELQTEVPWDHTTQTPTHNPLENYQYPSLLPKDVDERLLAKQIEVVADGVCDALVLAFFEMKREKESQPWKDRHTDAQGHWRVLGFMAVRWPDHGWKSEYPAMEKYWRQALRALCLWRRSPFVSFSTVD
nr:hypothetical protein B0A51_11289 [Rachicladosporium sp. CCFEE 5018]